MALALCIGSFLRGRTSTKSTGLSSAPSRHADIREAGKPFGWIWTGDFRLDEVTVTDEMVTVDSVSRWSARKLASRLTAILIFEVDGGAIVRPAGDPAHDGVFVSSTASAIFARFKLFVLLIHPRMPQSTAPRRA